MAKYFFFVEDINALRQTMEELHEKVRELGKEQGEAAAQSTENFGHDDACQEAIYEARRTVTGRLAELDKVLRNVEIVTPQGPFDRVFMGATVELSDGRTIKIGSYMVLASHSVSNVSYDSPIAQALLNKREGDEVELRGDTMTIKSIR